MVRYEKIDLCTMRQPFLTCIKRAWNMTLSKQCIRHVPRSKVRLSVLYPDNFQQEDRLYPPSLGRTGFYFKFILDITT